MNALDISDRKPGNWEGDPIIGQSEQRARDPGRATIGRYPIIPLGRKADISGL